MILGIDCGATKTKILLTDANLSQVIASTTIDTLHEFNYAEFLDYLTQHISELIIKTKQNQLTKIGMGLPGVIKNNFIHASSVKLLNNQPLAKDLNRIFKVPVLLENDSKCFALAEALLGAGKKYNSVIGLVIGTGLAAGYIENKKLYHGTSYSAGEYGHTQVNPLGAKCYCGNWGCLETLISGRGIGREFFELTGKKLSSKQIYQLYKQKDEAAVKVFTSLLRYYAIAIAGIINVFDPDIVVLGGGLSNVEELYTSGLKQVEQYIFSDSLTTPIVKNEKGSAAGVWGACLLN